MVRQSRRVAVVLAYPLRGLAQYAFSCPKTNVFGLPSRRAESLCFVEMVKGEVIDR
jgi:hypothetical protein